MPARRFARPSTGAFLAALTAFAIAMGHLEAVVVVYIRRLLDVVPMPEHLDADFVSRMPDWLIATEQGREAATIVMLLALGWLVGRSPLAKLGTFLYAFGVWDIFYYVSLKVLIGWPASLQTRDCLFLIPNPWYAPVWLPVSISLVMIAIALALFASSRGGKA
jgi:hypothetical protein